MPRGCRERRSVAPRDCDSLGGMHESSLARQLLTAALDAASRANARRVEVVRGGVAETEALDGAAIRFHFEALAKDTIAEGARLELQLVHTDAQCERCGLVYKPEHHLTLCPGCGSTDAVLLGSTGLSIDSIDTA